MNKNNVFNPIVDSACVRQRVRRRRQATASSAGGVDDRRKLTSLTTAWRAHTMIVMLLTLLDFSYVEPISNRF
jgi:hypothetical protein